jgi:hypothetical protein
MDLAQFLSIGDLAARQNDLSSSMGPDSGDSWAPRAVAEDVRAGYVSAEAARRDYGLEGTLSTCLQKNGEGASWPPCAKPASAT